MYDLDKRIIFTEPTATEVIAALSSLPGNCKVFLGGSSLVALHVSSDEKICSFDEDAELEGEYSDEINAFLVDAGILLDNGDSLFADYSNAYDKKYGYYDEDQHYVKKEEQAIEEAKKYVEMGVEKTYAIVSKTVLPAHFDFNEGYVEDEKYLVEDVIYSIAKIDGKIIENFLESKN